MMNHMNVYLNKAKNQLKGAWVDVSSVENSVTLILAGNSPKTEKTNANA